MAVLPWSLACGKVYYVDQASPKARDYLAPGNAEVPFKTLAAACHKASAGDTVIVQPGVYREILTPVRSGRKDAPITFQAGGPGVWIKGSDVIGGWTREGAFWVKRPWRPRMFYDAKSMDGMGMAPFHSSARMEQVFIDGKPLQWTPDRKSLKPWCFYWAPDGNEIVLCLPPDVDPNQTMVEVPARPCVVAAWPDTDIPRSRNEAERLGSQFSTFGLPPIDWVIIRGFRFAHNTATINRSGVRIQGHHWFLEDNIVEWMNTNGIGVDDGAILRNNITRFNGQSGIGGSARDALLDGNVSYYDNFRNFSTSWAGCGLKFALTENTTVINQGVIGSTGSGIWFDIDCYGIIIQNCTVLSNRLDTGGGSHGGIFYEVSYQADIRNNVIFGNHWNIKGKDAYGGGITISSSTKVVAENNISIFCDNGFSILGETRTAGPNARGRYWTAFGTDAFHAREIQLRNNLVVGDLTKAWGLTGDETLHESSENHFTNNTFFASCSANAVFGKDLISNVQEMQTLHPAIFKKNESVDLSNPPSPVISARLKIAATRILRVIGRILPEAPTDVQNVLGIWRFSGLAQGLAVQTDTGIVVLTDVPTAAKLAIESKSPIAPVVWSAATGEWKKMNPTALGYYLDSPPGFTLITRINSDDKPIP